MDVARTDIGLVVLGEEVGAPACDVDFDLHFTSSDPCPFDGDALCVLRVGPIQDGLVEATDKLDKGSRLVHSPAKRSLASELAYHSPRGPSELPLPGRSAQSSGKGTIVSRISTLLAFLLIALASLPVRADSWASPRVKTYTSESGGFSFTVEPLPLDSQLSYFEEKSKGTADVSSDSRYPKGRLASQSGDVLWERKLVNEVAPVSALVSEDGSYVVTFDNWHSVGYGDDVVVIYGRSGELVRALSLTEIVGKQRASEFPRSVSSIWWSGDHRLESGKVLALSILAKGSDPYDDDAKFETVRVRLKDGVVIAP